jgi:hypothetical protein
MAEFNAMLAELDDKLAEIIPPITLMAGDVQDLGAAATGAVGDVAGLGAAASAAGADAEGAASGTSAFGDAAGAAGDAAAGATPEVAGLNDNVAGIASTAKEAEAATNDLIGTMLEIGGIGVSIAAIKAALTDMVKEFATTERAAEAFSMILGSAEAGAVAIEHLKDMAQELAIPFDELVPMAQKMAAMGLTTEQTTRALTTAADASRYSGVSFDTASAAMLRMAEGGMVSGRFLLQLGANMNDLAAVMEVKSNEVAASFRALTVTDRWEVLQAALAKTAGAAEKTADDTTGAMTRMVNEWKFGLEQMGEGLAVIVRGVENFSKYVEVGFAAIMIEWDTLGAKAAGIAEVIGGVFSRNAGQISEGLAKYSTAAAETNTRLDALIALQEKVASTTDAAAFSITKVGAALDPVVKATHDYVPLIQEVATEQEIAAAAAEAQNAHVLSLSMTLDGQNQKLYTAEQNFAHVANAMRDGLTTYAAYKQAADELSKAESEAEKAQAAFVKGTEAPAMTTAFDGSKTAIVGMVEALGTMLPATEAIIKPAQTLAEAFKVLKLTVDDVSGDVEQKMVAAFDTVAASNKTTLQQVEAAWGQASDAISKVAKTDLPEAIKQQGIYVDALERTNAPLNQILAAEAARLKNQIALAQQQQTSADQYIIELANINERVLVLDATTNILGRAYQGLMADVNKAFSSLSANVSQGIIQGESFTKIWQTVWKGFAQEILSTAITAIEDLVLKWLVSAGIIHTSTVALTAAQKAASAAHVAALGTEQAAVTALATVEKAASATHLAELAAQKTAVTILAGEEKIANATEQAGLTAEGGAVTTLGGLWDTYIANRIAGLTALKVASSAVDVGVVMGEAGVAGAAGFASVMETIPFPANVALAPVVGAAAAATVLASFVPLAAFEQGIDYVPQDMLALIHKGEKITPASQNTSTTNNGAPVSVTINVIADRRPSETARQLVRHLKTLSPVFSPMGAG